MHLLLCLIQLWQPASLSGDLLSQLENGTPSFSAIEKGLIASGIETQEDLKKALASWEPFLANLMLSDKQKKQNESKQFKALQKKLEKNLKSHNAGASLLDAITTGQYDNTTASYLFHLAALANDLDQKAWPNDVKPADSFFAKPENREAHLLAALFLQTQDDRVSEDLSKATRHLNISSRLVPENVFQEDHFSRVWYNRVHKLYEAKDIAGGAPLAAAAAKRFPQLPQFAPLCYNFAILVSQDQGISLEDKLTLISALSAQAGEHSPALNETLGGLQYNASVTHYQEKKYAQAWDIAKNLTSSPSPDDVKNLKVAILEGLIEEKMSQGQDASKLLNTFKGLDPARHDDFQTRIKQIAVKASFDSGDFESALDLASKQLDSESGRNNYLAVLHQLVNQMNGKGQFEKALTRLDAIDATVIAPKELSNLKYNTYVAWLDKNQGNKSQFPIYRRMLGDSSLQLKEEEKTILKENWGNAYYAIINKMIEDRQFKDAEKLSSEALKATPKHKNLLKQKELIATIMSRIQ